MTDRPRRALAIIPAYREAETIGPIVESLRAQELEVVVIDDHSPDRTARVARQAGAKVIKLPVNLGYGGALQTGYLYARQNGADAIVQLDADGQHDPAYATEMLTPVLAGEVDLVLGSRFLEPGQYRMPLPRRVGRAIFGGLVNVITGQRITDPTSGYQAMSRKVINAYCTRLFPEDYPDADMFVLLHRMGIRVKEMSMKMYPSPDAGMHGGIRNPLYYAYKMSLAIFLALIRDLPQEETQ